MAAMFFRAYTIKTNKQTCKYSAERENQAEPTPCFFVLFFPPVHRMLSDDK